MKHKNDFVYHLSVKNRKKIIDKLLALDFVNSSEEEIGNLLTEYRATMRDLRNSQ
jgi:hypothetical protein